MYRIIVIEERSLLIYLSVNNISKLHGRNTFLQLTLSVVIVFAFLKILGMPAYAQNAATKGAWSEPVTLPVEGVHLGLLHTGDIFIYPRRENTAGDITSYVFDPNDPLNGVSANSPFNYYCGGMTVMADGRYLMNGGETIGGAGIKETGYLDPYTKIWNNLPDMHRPRWYPSTIMLGDGRIITFGGTDREGGSQDNSIEIYTPGGEWELIEGGNLPWQSRDAYVRVHLLPDGNVFMSGQNTSTFVYNVNMQSWSFLAETAFNGRRFEGVSVRLQDGRIMINGGSHTPSGGEATNTNEVIDLESADPQWQLTASMNHIRIYHNSVLLPDGSVFIVGGFNKVCDCFMYIPEIYDPLEDEWTEMARQQISRGYHSAALLLPDGRVICSGGIPEVGLEQAEIEIFSPPYLFKGPRPEVISHPAAAEYGAKIQVGYTSADPIASVTLQRPGTATHSFIYNQIGIPLSFSDDSTRLTIDIPTNPNLIPPGYYMLFLLSDNGVPSIAPFIQITPETQQNQPPQAENDSTSTMEDTRVTIAVLANDVDPENDSIIITNVSQPAHGAVTVDPANTLLIYSPEENYYGLDTFIYSVVDEHGGMDSAAVIISILPINDPPSISTLWPDSLRLFSTGMDTLDIWSYVEDVESVDSLLNYQFTVTSDSLVLSYSQTTGQLFITAGETAGHKIYIMYFSVDDLDGGTATDSAIVTVQPLTSIDNHDPNSIPDAHTLKQNYPNPFNPATSIEFSLSAAADVKLVIYNTLGEEVRQLVNESKAAGSYTISWDGKDNRNQPLPSGIYFYRFDANRVHDVKKMLLVR